MKAAVIFTGTGPILIVTTYESLYDDDLAGKLRAKGIKKYILSEVSVDRCKELYGNHFYLVTEDLNPSNDIRVLDYDGHHIFLNFPFSEMGELIRIGE
jgi:hypothetical protein